MGTMRESWTDARLDDFAAHTDQRFDSLERRMENGFAEINARFDALQRVLIQGVIALSGAFIAGFAALIVLVATQL
jgi:hypothetical protein